MSSRSDPATEQCVSEGISGLVFPPERMWTTGRVRLALSAR